ncbi:MAG: 1-deoxy-D-xylulose-5-phosphate reductoisomerase [bacterium]
MTRRIAVLGSTGSIGTQTLEVVRAFPDEFEVVALTTHHSVEALRQQADEFDPDFLGVSGNVECPDDWKQGEAALERAARMELDLLVLAVVGTAGLKPCLTALKRGTDVGLATKEVMVSGGPLVNKARRDGGNLIPLDSEHHALADLLAGEPENEVKTLILTASGGPFRTREGDLSNVSPEEALDHPNWDMGPKITIDSATMMNKGLEVIEAKHLFECEPDQIKALIHPESTVHALVEFQDHSVQAHLSVPDMRLTLQSALFHPHRREAVVEAVPFEEGLTLNFEPVDPDQFPAYALARRAMEAGGGAPAILNTANKVAVEAFLEERISFEDIARVVEECLNDLERESNLTYEAIRRLESDTRKKAEAIVSKK